MLYKMIKLPSDEPIVYVGVYVMKWGREDEPTVAFRPATKKEIDDEWLDAQSRLEATDG